MARESGLLKELAALEGEWKKQSAKAKAEGGLRRVPDTKYIARLSEASVENPGSGLRMKIVFVILEGDYTGETLTKTDGLTGERSLEFLCRTLARLGYDPDDVSLKQLPAICAELTKEKPVCNVQARTGANDFQNVFINSVIEDYDEESGSGAVAEEAAEEEEGEEAEESGELGVGSRVSGTFRNVAYTGDVLELVDAETARVKRDDTGTVLKAKIANLTLLAAAEAEEEEEAEEAEEEAAEEAEEEPAPLQVGMKVEFPWKGKEDETGVVTEILDAERAKVKKDSDGKIATVKIENLFLIEEDADAAEGEEEEEEEAAPAPAQAPPPSGRRGKTPAPAAAPEPSGKTGATATRRPAAATAPAAAPARRKTK
jgi:hypothetical protein